MRKGNIVAKLQRIARYLSKREEYEDFPVFRWAYHVAWRIVDDAANTGVPGDYWQHSASLDASRYGAKLREQDQLHHERMLEVGRPDWHPLRLTFGPIPQPRFLAERDWLEQQTGHQFEMFARQELQFRRKTAIPGHRHPAATRASELPFTERRPDAVPSSPRGQQASALQVDALAALPPKKQPQREELGEVSSMSQISHSKGPRRGHIIAARVNARYMDEILQAAFTIQGENEKTADLAGQILEDYGFETCELLFGMTYAEYVQRREAGQKVRLLEEHKKMQVSA